MIIDSQIYVTAKIAEQVDQKQDYIIKRVIGIILSCVKDKPWRNTNNFMLLGVRPFLLQNADFDENLMKFLKESGANGKKMSFYRVEGVL